MKFAVPLLLTVFTSTCCVFNKLNSFKTISTAVVDQTEPSSAHKTRDRHYNQASVNRKRRWDPESILDSGGKNQGH